MNVRTVRLKLTGRPETNWTDAFATARPLSPWINQGAAARLEFACFAADGGDITNPGNVEAITLRIYRRRIPAEAAVIAPPAYADTINGALTAGQWDANGGCHFFFYLSAAQTAVAIMDNAAESLAAWLEVSGTLGADRILLGAGPLRIYRGLSATASEAIPTPPPPITWEQFAALEMRQADTEGAVSMMAAVPDEPTGFYEFQAMGLRWDWILFNPRIDPAANPLYAGRQVYLVSIDDSAGTITLAARGLLFDILNTVPSPDPSTGTAGGRLYLASATPHPDTGTYALRSQGTQIRAILSNAANTSDLT